MIEEIRKKLIAFSKTYEIEFWERMDTNYPKYGVFFRNLTNYRHREYTIDCDIEYSDSEFIDMIETLKEDVLIHLYDVYIVD